MNISQKDKTRFYSKQIISGDCLIWVGSDGDDGYGRMSLNGTTTLTHKIAFYLKHYREPASYLIHTCNNKLCVNPDHIIEGKNKGRPVKVSAQIIRDLKNDGMTPSEIAKQLGCSVSLVRRRLNYNP